MLRTGLLSGEITEEMTPKQVYDGPNKEEHNKWPYNNWSASLARLRAAIARDKSRMMVDVSNYSHDLAIVKSTRQPGNKTPWHRTECPKLLKQDVNEGQHLKLTPVQFHQSRDEYKDFNLSVFRKHIYQEVDSRPKRDFRWEKKKKAWRYLELHDKHPRLQSQQTDNTSD